MRSAHDKAKQTQKKYKDAPANVKPNNIQPGDNALLLRRGSKTSPRYDHRPYKVIGAQGTRITATRGEQTVTRDAQRFKRVNMPTHESNYRPQRYSLDRYQDDRPCIGPADMPRHQGHPVDNTGGPPVPEAHITPSESPLAGTSPSTDLPEPAAETMPEPLAAGLPKRITRPPVYLADFVRH